MYYCDDTGCEIQTYQCFALLTKVYGLFQQHTKGNAIMLNPMILGSSLFFIALIGFLLILSHPLKQSNPYV